mmetsp:Transcript_60109/g.166376  ORF Transcript_60109/g.166376 Transcript_60109/m.166376 type:complete len:255 (+) Transcript_60109:58-822(+)
MGAHLVKKSTPRVPEPVILHIYDLTTDPDVVALNRVLRSVLGTGAFHCGVEVFQREWSFRFTKDGSSGVFSEHPRGCRMASYCDSVFMGTTAMNEREVMELLQAMSRDWQGDCYDILTRNCCHFCVELCKRLGAGGTFPPFILHLASTGNLIREGIDSMAEEVNQCNRCISQDIGILAETVQIEGDLFCRSAGSCCTRWGAPKGQPPATQRVPEPKGPWFEWEEDEPGLPRVVEDTHGGHGQQGEGSKPACSLG